LPLAENVQSPFFANSGFRCVRWLIVSIEDFREEHFMTRKLLLMTGSVLLLAALFLAVGVINVSGQEEAGPPIVTTANNVVGIGTYVAAQAFGLPAGEDPAAAPAVAMILPYGIDPDMMVMSIDEFEQPASLAEDFTFEWSLVAPEGSAAELISGGVAIFMADVEGQYDLTLKATDANGNVGETTWTVYASTYVGVGGLTGEAPSMPQCGTCHADKAKEWFATGHASMLTRGLNGTLSSHYGESCISCHTTGYDTHPEAVNGGFDDLAAEAGWTFPAELKEGVWDEFVAQYPQVAAMANIQCESCHGPGGLHTSEMNPEKIGVSLNYGTCAQCHAEGPYHIYPVQWENSAHGNVTSPGFTSPIGPEETACVRCHSGVGFIDYVNGVPEEERRTDYQPITCAVCHDPHSAENPYQLRVYNTVTLPSGMEVADAGPAATCMTCHNGRRDGGAEGQVAAGVAGESFSTVHHGNNQAELMNMTGGYTWDATLPVSTHGNVVEGACIGCHMGPTPGMDDMGTPDDTSDDQPLPGHNEVGVHSFAMVSADGVENVAVCQQCHDGATSFEFESRRDYDGDGAVETVQEEVAGLRELVWNALLEAGVTPTDSRPYFAIPEGAGEDIYGALWNYYFTEAEGTAVHNFRYAVSLLQLSYEKLAGEPVPGAVILPPKS
jgi:hypothetical protein